MWPFLFCIRIENFEGACTGQNFLEISDGRKTVRMAPILTIFGPNESQRCQLNFQKNLGRRKNFREGEKFEKLSRKVRKILPRTRFLGRNKIETAIWLLMSVSLSGVPPLERKRLKNYFKRLEKINV